MCCPIYENFDVSYRLPKSYRFDFSFISIVSVWFFSFIGIVSDSIIVRYSSYIVQISNLSAQKDVDHDVEIDDLLSDFWEFWRIMSTIEILSYRSDFFRLSIWYRVRFLFDVWLSINSHSYDGVCDGGVGGGGGGKPIGSRFAYVQHKSRIRSSSYLVHSK